MESKKEKQRETWKQQKPLFGNQTISRCNDRIIIYDSIERELISF